jgi:hypothetical protein
VPSPPDAPRALLRLSVAVLMLCAAPGMAAVQAELPAAPVAGAGDANPTDAEVERAVEAVKKDPNLSAERTVRTLDWNPEKKKKKKREDSKWPSWLSWIGDLFLWIAQLSRVLVWVVIAILIGLLATFIIRVFASSRDGLRGGTRFVAPTHVQDLDIRPESLPPDIGAAARALWDRGEQRAALALLYRGLLSRLAHVYQVPIRDSSTEGDCLLLAERRLDAARAAYATRLVRTWQRAIYGGIQVETADVRVLCAGFAQHLDAPPNAAATDSQPAGAPG